MANLAARPRVVELRLGPATGLARTRIMAADQVVYPGSRASASDNGLRIQLAANAFVRVLVEPAQ